MADSSGTDIKLPNLMYKADSVQALKDLYEPSHATNWGKHFFENRDFFFSFVSCH